MPLEMGAPDQSPVQHAKKTCSLERAVAFSPLFFSTPPQIFPFFPLQVMLE